MRSTILTTSTTYSTTSYLTTEQNTNLSEQVSNTVASEHVQTSSPFTKSTTSKPSLKTISNPITYRNQSTTSFIATYYSQSSTISYPALNITKQMKPEVISG